MAAGFQSHEQPLKSARMALDEISHELAPSHWLEERSADKKPAQQLGTLGGGNHFLEVLPSPNLHMYSCVCALHVPLLYLNCTVGLSCPLLELFPLQLLNQSFPFP